MTTGSPSAPSQPLAPPAGGTTTDSGPLGPESSFRCGYVALSGKPNAGKSTLLNALLGEKIAIVTPKAQTTRDRILGFHTTASVQAIFIDMPGLIEPHDRFNEVLMEIADEAIDGADLGFHLVDVRDPEPFPPFLVERLARVRFPLFLVWTHCDRLERHQVVPDPAPEAARLFRGIHAISGTAGFGIAALLEDALPLLPVGPALYPADDLTDRDLRFLAAEIVREKLFLHTGAEVPYGAACVVEEYRERPDDPRPDYIRVTIHVERESHKHIVIGERGQMLRTIGAAARADIERLVGKAVFLDLWVKDRKNWRKSDREIARFGYVTDRRRRRREARREKRAGAGSAGAAATAGTPAAADPPDGDSGA